MGSPRNPRRTLRMRRLRRCGTCLSLLLALDTTVLICSSLTMALGVHYAAIGKQKLLILFLILTLILGGAFLGVKTIEYHDKWVHHEIPGEHFECEGCADAGHASLFFSL